MTNQGLEIQSNEVDELDILDELTLEMVPQEIEEGGNSADLHPVSCVSPISSSSSSSRFPSNSNSTVLQTSHLSSTERDQRGIVKRATNLRTRRLIETKRTYDSVLGNDVRNPEKDDVSDDTNDRRSTIVVQIPSLTSSLRRNPAIAKMGLPPLLILSPASKVHTCNAVSTPTKYSYPAQSSPTWAPSSSSSSQPSSVSCGSYIDVDEQPLGSVVSRFTITKEQQPQIGKQKKKGSPDGVYLLSSEEQSSPSDSSSLSGPNKKTNRLSFSMPSPIAMYNSDDNQNKLPPIQFGVGCFEGDSNMEDMFYVDSYNALQMCMSPQNNDKGFMDIRIPKFRFSPDNPFASRKTRKKRNAKATDHAAIGNAIIPIKLSNYNKDYDTIRLKYVDSNKKNRRKSF